MRAPILGESFLSQQTPPYVAAARVWRAEGTPYAGMPVGMKFLTGDPTKTPVLTVKTGDDGIAVFPLVAMTRVRLEPLPPEGEISTPPYVDVSAVATEKFSKDNLNPQTQYLVVAKGSREMPTWQKVLIGSGAVLLGLWVISRGQR